MTTGQTTLTTSDLVYGLAGELLPPGSRSAADEIRIRQVVIDSRLATPGSLFVALRGQELDGNDFVADAFDRGAVAAIAEKAPPGAVCTDWLGAEVRQCQLGEATCLVVPDSLAALQRVAAHWRQQHQVRVIGITGSVGKTISKEYIAAVLRQRYSTLKSEGSYNNEIGLPVTLLHVTGLIERVVLEMGMYDIGEINQLVHIAAPQVGVVTNVGHTHLERLGTIDRIARAKLELPNALPPASEGGVAILNADDERVRRMADQTQARVFTYGLRPDADLWADAIESEGLEGIRLRFHHRGEQVNVRVPMLGHHSAHTALCAAAVGLNEGLTWSEIIAGLQDPSAQLRLVALPGPEGSTILDDTYNASPVSCIAALDLLDELEGRKIAVLGDMYELGNYEAEGHKLVGRHASAVTDLLITVGQLGRIIGEEAIQSGMTSDTVHLMNTNAQAIILLRRLIADGPGCDCVLIKGSRGMGMEKIVAALGQDRKPAASLAKDNCS